MDIGFYNLLKRDVLNCENIQTTTGTVLVVEKEFQKMERDMKLAL